MCVCPKCTYIHTEVIVDVFMIHFPKFEEYVNQKIIIKEQIPHSLGGNYLWRWSRSDIACEIGDSNLNNDPED